MDILTAVVVLTINSALMYWTGFHYGKNREAVKRIVKLAVAEFSKEFLPHFCVRCGEPVPEGSTRYHTGEWIHKTCK